MKYKILLLSFLFLANTANGSTLSDGLILQQQFNETLLEEDSTSSAFYDINTRTLYTVENLIGESWTNESTELTLFLVRQSFTNCTYISEVRALYADEPVLFKPMDTMLYMTHTVLQDGKVIGVHTLSYKDCIDGGTVTPVDFNKK
ncbi:hypothetical protein CGI91_23080 [Vibrio parahaemolyticus]|uniref:hypothetical protein n=1 Tax=Vibrio parahaemolyticus TaxID=670 RepID=UPI0011210255|nr:hypothetical protein [Vibrio parahaemolyticus]TOG86491.1 hypothetical protein CGI91_23080 [Vibrio parahaemolyticus]